MIWTKHIKEELLPYWEGNLAAVDAKRVQKHVEGCDRCRRKSEETARGIFLASHLKRAVTPRLDWTEIEQALGREPHAIRFWTWRTVAAASATACLALLVCLSLLMRASHDSVGLDSYLNEIEVVSPDAASRAVAKRPEGFVDAGQDAALKAAGVYTPDATVIDGYRLAEQRMKRVGKYEVVQLVYRRGESLFAVFVAPQEIPFSFGKREIDATTRKGITCKEVRCPHTSTILFGANRFHCVLVSKSKDSDDEAAIMAYFIAAHGRTNGV
jgi:anti-sigma factor RsiW